VCGPQECGARQLFPICEEKAELQVHGIFLYGSLRFEYIVMDYAAIRRKSGTTQSCQMCSEIWYIKKIENHWYIAHSFIHYHDCTDQIGSMVEFLGLTAG